MKIQKRKEMNNMKRIKVTKKEYLTTGKYIPVRPWAQWLCSYYLEQHDNGCYVREVRLSTMTRILSYIPAKLIELMWCLWDGGLKSFDPRMETIIDRLICWPEDGPYESIKNFFE
jgi:hypothetical protein